MFAVLETPVRAASPQRTGTPDVTRSALRLQGLSVSYGRARPALPAVDLTVAAGEYLGVVGPSGCGKSTLLAVLLRFVPPSGGRVLVDGPDGATDLLDLDERLWRRRIAWVPQQPWLAASSIEENVRLARPEADDADVAAALDAAGAADFVSALPRGRSTVLGVAGAGLSAGQRQRVALARAFLRNAPLVLLDEPTAHLDPVSEAAVAAAVRRLAVGRTVIAVAHRPALLADADRVVSLDRSPLEVPALASAGESR